MKGQRKKEVMQSDSTDYASLLSWPRGRTKVVTCATFEYLKNLVQFNCVIAQAARFLTAGFSKQRVNCGCVMSSRESLLKERFVRLEAIAIILKSKGAEM